MKLNNLKIHSATPQFYRRGKHISEFKPLAKSPVATFPQSNNVY